MGLNICWWDDTLEGKKEFYKSVSLEDLIKIAEDGNYIEDVPYVLRELLKRNFDKAIDLAKSILKEEKGDMLLRDWVSEFLEDIKDESSESYVI